MRPELAFRPLAAMERCLAELYGSWADVFADDPEAAFIFFKMSTEEKGHANLVDYQRRFAQQNPDVVREVDIDLTDIRSAVERVKTFREENPRPSLDTALSLALTLEESAAETHCKNALRQANPGMERLLGSLGGEDRQHVARLKDFVARRREGAASAA